MRLRTVTSTGAGFALATITYVSFIELASYLTGNSSWIAILTSGVIATLASLCFSELVGMYPTAAGIKLFIERAFNERVALILASIYVIAQLSVVGAETFILGEVLQEGFPGIPSFLWGLLFLLAIAFLNIRGIKLAGTTQDVIAYTMFGSLIILSLYGFWTIDFRIPKPLSVGSADGFLQAVGVGIAAYIGFEWVINMAEEVTDTRILPKGMLLALGLLCITYGLFSMAMTSTLGMERLGWVLDPDGKPIPHLLFARHLLGAPGLYLMVALSITASLTSFNAGVMTASRFIYAMSRDRALPKALSRLHPRWATPWVSILTLGIFALGMVIAVFITRQVVAFIFIIASVECLIYVTMALCVLRLRRRSPETPRPLRVPGGPVIPLLVMAIYAFLGLGILFGPTKPQDAMAQRICQIFVLGLGAVVCAYVLWCVPRLRAKYEAMAAARRPRRRRKMDRSN
jgi:amino acid transporter